MKVGDKVRVTDGSYTMSILGNKLEHISGGQLMGKGTHTIIAFDCILPGWSDFGHPEANNTIIKSSDGAVTFIKDRFLASVDKFCGECGAKLAQI